MKRRTRQHPPIWLGAGILALILSVVTLAFSQETQAPASPTPKTQALAGEKTPGTAPTARDAGLKAQAPQDKYRYTGSQVYRWQCGRCHRLRAINERTDREWEIIADHMRLSGRLSAEQARKVLGFLKEFNEPPKK